MSKGQGSKPQKAYQALRRLMAQSGDVGLLWGDLLSLEGDEPIDTPPYDDRAAAIVFGAMVEQALETAIATHFPNPDEILNVFGFGEDGALPTFASKISLGHALGIFEGALLNDLRWISRIRNAFAHTRVPINFSTSEIAGCCSLMTPRPMVDAEDRELPPLTSRQIYSINAAIGATYLTTPTEGQALRYREVPYYLKVYGVKP